MPVDRAIDINGQPMVMWGEFFRTLEQSLSYSAFWVGFTLVVLFALNRFSISEDRSDDIDPPLVARSFTTRFRYYLSATAYVGWFEFIYVILVGIGSFPFLQGLLKELIGSLELPGAEEGIGSPAWAALVATSLLPSAWGFRAADQKIRDFLHRFASIPNKARALAQEIIDETAKLNTLSVETVETVEQIRLRQLNWLAQAVETLQDGIKNPRNASQYTKFFSRYRDAYKRAVDREVKYVESVKSTTQQSPFLIKELTEMVQYMARFLSCALLQIEPSERDVRKTVRTRLALNELPHYKFSFSLKQIIIGIVIAVFITFIAGLTTLKLALIGLEIEPTDLSVPMILFIVGWVPYAALMLVPPFILAAGVQLYFMDRRNLDKEEVPWEDKFLVLTSLFVGAYCLGVLPPLAGMALESRTVADDWLLQILPFGLAPALLAIAFYAFVSCCPTHSRLKNALIDFGVFACISGLALWLSTWLATDFGLDIGQAAGDVRFTNKVALIVFPITAAVLVGALGAIQCAISRNWEENAVSQVNAAEAST